jgi:hypothetical protein
MAERAEVEIATQLGMDVVGAELQAVVAFEPGEVVAELKFADRGLLRRIRRRSDAQLRRGENQDRTRS